MEIRCPHCDQSLEIQPEHLGCEVTCPACSQDFTIPAPATAPQDDTIECPFCAEPIKPNARKCRHCGEFLDGSKPTLGFTGLRKPSTTRKDRIHGQR